MYMMTTVTESMTINDKYAISEKSCLLHIQQVRFHTAEQDCNTIADITNHFTALMRDKKDTVIRNTDVSPEMTASRKEDIDASPLKDLATILNVMDTAI